MLGDVLALVVAYAVFVAAVWYLQARDERRERQREADREQQREDEPDLLETVAA